MLLQNFHRRVVVVVAELAADHQALELAVAVAPHPLLESRREFRRDVLAVCQPVEQMIGELGDAQGRQAEIRHDAGAAGASDRAVEIDRLAERRRPDRDFPADLVEFAVEGKRLAG